jgi:hypothetical protein
MTGPKTKVCPECGLVIAYEGGSILHRLCYPKTFASEYTEMPFHRDSLMGVLIADCDKEKAAFLSEPDNRLSVDGVKYTTQQLDALWQMILAQRVRMQAAWLVREGRFVAINPAIRHLAPLSASKRHWRDIP